MDYSKAQMVSVDVPNRVCYSNKADVEPRNGGYLREHPRFVFSLVAF